MILIASKLELRQIVINIVYILRYTDRLQQSWSNPFVDHGYKYSNLD